MFAVGVALSDLVVLAAQARLCSATSPSVAIARLRLLRRHARQGHGLWQLAPRGRLLHGAVHNASVFKGSY